MSEENNQQDTPITEEDRRRARRNRRIRNQILSYCVIVVIVAILVCAGVLIYHVASNRVTANEQQEEILAEEEMPPAEEELRIETPDAVTEEISQAEEEDAVDAVLEDPLGEIIDACLEAMPLADKVAGLFFITPEELTGVSTVMQAGETTQDALLSYAIGGLFYSAKNFRDEEQVETMLSATVSMSKYPIFLAVSEEGGDASPVASSLADTEAVLSPAALAETGDTAQAYDAGATIGAYLAALGFDLDFAPVANGSETPVNGVAAASYFGETGADSSAWVSAMTQGLEESGTHACLKYFADDFAAFESGIEAGATAILVGGGLVTDTTGEDIPAALSAAVITNTIRADKGYTDLIVISDLSDSSVTDSYDAAEAAILAIEAGADMLLSPADFTEAYEGVLAAVEDGRITEERIEESLRRIYRVKYADKI